VKPARVQTFVTQLSRKTLDVSILHGPTRLR
jgi:hypothetical protein